MNQEILQVAKLCRKEVEKFARENIIGDYKTLECYCAIASTTLFFCLKKLGYKPKLIDGVYWDEYNYGDVETHEKEIAHLTPIDTNHCWVEIDDTIIDLTETQFEQECPKVSVHKVNRAKRYVYRISNTRSYKTIRDWPSEQQPFFHFKKISKRVLEQWQNQKEKK